MDPLRIIDEVLEAIWTLEETAEASLSDVSRIAHTDVTDRLLQQIQQQELIEIDRSGRVSLTPQGRMRAAQIIRRHRLAERLMCDILGVEVKETEDAACEFEHGLADGITNAICTLLGHPRFCPHGRSIPEAPCCQRARDRVDAIVVSCDHLRIGETAPIAYISSQNHPRLLKLAALGVTPGIRLKLLQKWPTYVIQCEETEIALEEEIARNIHVRRDQQQ